MQQHMHQTEAPDALLEDRGSSEGWRAGTPLLHGGLRQAEGLSPVINHRQQAANSSMHTPQDQAGWHLKVVE